MYNSEFGRRLRTQSSGAGAAAGGASGSASPSGASRAHLRADSHGASSSSAGPSRRGVTPGASTSTGIGSLYDEHLDGAAGLLASPSRAGARRESTGGLERTREASGEPARPRFNGDRPRTPGRHKVPAYADRYIPSRDVSDMQTVYQLMGDEGTSTSRQKRKMAVDMDAQKEEANQAFSSLLTTELFGTATGSSHGAGANGHAAQLAYGSSAAGATGNMRHAASAAGSPATPTKKNLLSYHSPSPSSSRSRSVGTPGRSGGAERIGLYPGVTGVGPGERRGSSGGPVGLFGGGYLGGAAETLDSPHHSAYSLSPVKLESQRMLLSPRRAPRTLSKVPYKVLDAPELADDFYLNLVDWSSQNVMGVGLGQCVYLWSAKDANVKKLVDLSEGRDKTDRITGLNWSSNGRYLAVGTNSGEVQVWDAEHEKKVRTMTGHSSRVGALAWNSPILTTGSRDRSILHRDTREPEHHMALLRGHRQEVCGLKWNTMTNQLASGGNDNRLLVWDGLNTTPLHRFTEHTAAVKAIAWSPHQQGLLASGGGTADMRIRFWNTITGQLLSDIDTGSQVCNLLWSKTANELISTHGFSGGKVQHQIQVWRYPTMSQIATLTGHTMRVLYLAMSPDGETIVSGAGDETLRFWDLNTPSKSQLESRAAASSTLDPFAKLR